MRRALSGKLELLGVGLVQTVGSIADMHPPAPDTSGILSVLGFVNRLIQSIPNSICLVHPLRFAGLESFEVISNAVPEERR